MERLLTTSRKLNVLRFCLVKRSADHLHPVQNFERPSVTMQPCRCRFIAKCQIKILSAKFKPFHKNCTSGLPVTTRPKNIRRFKTYNLLRRRNSLRCWPSWFDLASVGSSWSRSVSPRSLAADNDVQHSFYVWTIQFRSLRWVH